MKKALSGLGLLLFLFIAGTQEATAWVQNPTNGHYYKAAECGDWNACESAAASLGGHLVTINDEAEQDWLMQTFGLSWYWIGFNDAALEGTWVWSSGEPATYTLWWPGEPNNMWIGENYAIMNWTSLGEWVDFGPSSPEWSGVTGGIIELPGAPPPIAELSGSWRSLDLVTDNGVSTLAGNFLVSNTGSVAAGGFDVTIHLSSDGAVDPSDTLLRSHRLNGLDVGKTRQISLNYVPPPTTEGWFQNPANGHYYKAASCGDWNACESTAVSLGGHLVTINDEAEQAWLMQTFGQSWHWIGFNDAAQEGTWVWSSGEPPTYTLWWPGEPNNMWSGENYAIMNWTSLGEWVDFGPTSPEWGGVTTGIIELPVAPVPDLSYLSNRKLIVSIDAANAVPEEEKRNNTVVINMSVLTAPWIANPATGTSYKAVDCGTWSQCESTAVALGGHLVSIGSVEEESWLLSTFGNTTQFWIGFNDVAQEGTWVWASGEPVTYTHWWPGEPNNMWTGGENFGVMNWTGIGEWVDIGTGSPEFGSITRGIIER